jgi:hypothetical protein
MAEGAGAGAPQAGTVGVGAVFEDEEVVAAGQLEDRRHVDGDAVEVHDHDGAGVRPDGVGE